MFNLFFSMLTLNAFSKAILTIISIAVIVFIAFWNTRSNSKEENKVISSPAIYIIGLFLFRRFVELCITSVRLDNSGWVICLGIVALIMLLYFMLKHCTFTVVGALIWGFIAIAIVVNYARISMFLPQVIIAVLIIGLKDNLDFGLIRTLVYVGGAILVVTITNNITIAFELIMLIDLAYRSIVNARVSYGIITLIGTTCLMYLGCTYLKSWIFFVSIIILYKIYFK